MYDLVKAVNWLQQADEHAKTKRRMYSHSISKVKIWNRSYVIRIDIRQYTYCGCMLYMMMSRIVCVTVFTYIANIPHNACNVLVFSFPHNNAVAFQLHFLFSIEPSEAHDAIVATVLSTHTHFFRIHDPYR